MRHCGVRRAIVSIISFGVSGALVCHLCTINLFFFLFTDNNRLISLYLPCCVGKTVNNQGSPFEASLMYERLDTTVRTRKLFSGVDFVFPV